MLSKKSIAALAAIFVLTAAASCGGGMNNAGMMDVYGVSEEQAGQYSAQLPSPSSIERGVSETTEQRWRFGNEYLLDFNSGENVHPKLDQLLMQPLFEDVQGVAWAGYRFWLPDYAGEHSVQVEIPGAGEPTPGTLYLGLANWDSNRWSFFAVPEDGNVATGALDPYIRYLDDQLYVVLLTDGQDDTAISSIRIGGELETTAVLKSDMAIGLAPTAITLDASDSRCYDGDILKYEFDPLGDGNWIDNGADSDIVQFYLDPGYFMAGLRVTDDQDNVAHAYLPIIVQGLGYDEIEDNDEIEQAQMLQAAPMQGFKGNFGDAGVHADDMDIYGFELEQSASVEVSLSLMGPGARLSLYRSFNNGGDIEPIELTDLKGVSKSINTSLSPGRYYIVIDSPLGGEGVDIDYTLDLDMSISEAPVVIIENYDMEVASGAALAFSIDNSYDPDGTIAVWSVDLNGDGHYEVNSGASGNFMFDAPKRPGHFLGKAKVVDNTGIASVKSFEITITGEDVFNFSETEPNDSYEGMDSLPNFDFEKLLGEVGGDINGPDMQDYYAFSTGDHGEISFQLDVVDEAFGEIRMLLVYWNGAEWDAVAQLNTGLDGMLTSGIESPSGDYVLIVTAQQGSSRYYIDGEFLPSF
jgi:hypothetical protein